MSVIVTDKTCPHGRIDHCCNCEDCARFIREPDWCGRCGQREQGIGWDNVCSTCEDQMRADDIDV